MKFLCKILLLFFITFLTAPTIVSLIDRDATISFFYTIEEDDTASSFDEIKCIQTIFSIPLLVDFDGFQKVQFYIFYDKIVTSIAPKIFLRPPE